MKHKLFTLLFALVASVCLCAQTSTPFVVWCSGNTTLYFDYGIVPEAGDSYNAQIVTNVWSGTTVTDTYAQPQWIDVASSTCTNVVFMPSFANAVPVTCYAWFNAFINLTSINGLNYLNTANVTNMNFMFSQCWSLTSLDLSSFNTTNVTSMYRMFHDCHALTSLNVSNFNTANVMYMSYMFCDCSALTSLDVSSFNTDNVTNMNHMFYGCNALTSLDLSNFNTANVTDMSFMFVSCNSLTSLDLSSFNTANVTDMWGMFSTCSSLTSLDVSSFNTANVTRVGWMFEHCDALTSLDLSSFNTANVTTWQGMFYQCPNLTTILVGDEWSTASAGDANSTRDVFDGCFKIRGGNGTTYDYNYTNTTYARIDEPGNPGYLTYANREAFVVWCSDNTTLYFDYNKIPEVGGTYNGQTVTNVWSGTAVTANYNTPQWKSVASSSCTNVVFTPGFANASPTTCYQWFAGFQCLTAIDGLNYLNTANVTTMWGMFSTCSLLTSLDLSSLNTANVTNVGWMFNSCNALETLDLTGFNTTNVEVWQGMFYQCPNLTTILVGDEWSTAGAGDANATRDVFYGCTSIRGGNGTTYDYDYTNTTYARIDEPSNPGYLTRKIHSVVLTDAEAYSLTQDLILEAATYQKSLDNDRIGKYQSWLVPFAYTLTDEDLEKFNFYRIHMIADSPEPGEGNDTGELWIYLKRLNSGFTLEANMPYVYKPKEAVSDYEFTTLNATLKAPQAGILASTQTMDDIFSFYATYDFTSPSAIDPFYYVNIDGGLSLGNESSVVVSPYRWILRVTSKNGAAPAPARSMHFVDEEDETSNATNINSIQAVEDGIWYSVDGRRLGTTRPATRGIYVQNGKKVVIY